MAKDFLPGRPYDKTRTFIENVCDFVKEKGPMQNFPSLVISNAVNGIVAGSSLPWNNVCTSNGLLYKLGAWPTKKNVHALAQKILSVWQATLEEKHNETGDGKIAVIKIDDIKDEELMLDLIIGKEVKCTKEEAYFHGDAEFYRFDPPKPAPPELLWVGAQVRAKITGHTNPMKYLQWEQVTVNDPAVFDGKYCHLKPGQDGSAMYAQATKVTLSAELLKECVKIMNSYKTQFTEATYAFFSQKSKVTKENNAQNTNGRFKGALRNMKAVAVSRKNRKRPKPQSHRTKVGQYGTGKANARTRAQGARAAGKKKSAVNKTISSLKTAIKKTIGTKANKKELLALNEKCQTSVNLLQKMLWITDPKLDQLALGDTEELTEKLVADLLEIAEMKDLYGDPRNLISGVPIEELMVCTGKPSLFTESGASFLFAALQYVSECSGGWLTDAYGSKSGVEQALVVAQACSVQTLNLQVLCHMIGASPKHNGNRIPGWNSPYATYGEFTNLEEGTVINIHYNEQRLPLKWLPAQLLKGRRVETSITNSGSSLIGLSGMFMAQIKPMDQNPKQSIQDTLEEFGDMTKLVGRGGFARVEGKTVIEDAEQVSFTMSNPQQIGHLAAIETTESGYKFGELRISAVELGKVDQYMTGKSKEKTALCVDLLKVYTIGHPYQDSKVYLEVVDDETFEIIRKMDKVGTEVKEGQASTSKNKTITWKGISRENFALKTVIKRPELGVAKAKAQGKYAPQGEGLKSNKPRFRYKGGYDDDTDADYKKANRDRRKEAIKARQELRKKALAQQEGMETEENHPSTSYSSQGYGYGQSSLGGPSVYGNVGSMYGGMLGGLTRMDSSTMNPPILQYRTSSSTAFPSGQLHDLDDREDITDNCPQRSAPGSSTPVRDEDQTASVKSHS